MGFFESSDWKTKNKIQSLLPKCGSCGLYQKCRSPKMKVEGKGRIPILFVDEFPGDMEDRRGKLFVDNSGQLIRGMLQTLGIDLDDCWRTAALICNPGDVKVDGTHADYCRPNLIKTIRDLKPKVIVLFGTLAVQSLIETEWPDPGSIHRWAGWTIPSAKYAAWVCPTFHPSISYRKDGNDPVYLAQIREHLRQAVKCLKKTPSPLRPDALRETIDVITDPNHARLRLIDLAKSEGVLAWDYETTGLKPEPKEQKLFCVSFCLNGEDTFAMTLQPSLYEYLSAVLKSKRLKKVASNLKFEERWTRCKLGHGVKAWNWDTMLAAHALDNRPGINSIKFQAYVLLGIEDYASKIQPFLKSKDDSGLNTIEKAPLKDVLLYCGMDSLIEFKVSEIQKGILYGKKNQTKTKTAKAVRASASL